MILYIYIAPGQGPTAPIRTTEAYLYYKLTNEPKGSGELIEYNYKNWNHYFEVKKH